MEGILEALRRSSEVEVQHSGDSESQFGGDAYALRCLRHAGRADLLCGHALPGQDLQAKGREMSVRRAVYICF